MGIVLKLLNGNDKNLSKQNNEVKCVIYVLFVTTVMSPHIPSISDVGAVFLPLLPINS